MSNTIKIDFDEIPYDLFNILELDEDCKQKDIKIAYKKAVIKYHPDKNKSADKDFFSWITLAYTILIDEQHREMYKEYKDWNDNHSKLKNNYIKLKNNNDIKLNNDIDIDTNTIIKKNADSFKKLNNELNKKHGYVENYVPYDKNQMEKLLSNKYEERNSISIEKKKITDLNKAVDDEKKKNMKLNNNNIINYDGNITDLSSFNKFGSINDIGKLYNEGNTIQGDNNVTSLDEAFKMSHYQEFIKDNISLEDKIKEYNNYKVPSISKKEKKDALEKLKSENILLKIK